MFLQSLFRHETNLNTSHVKVQLKAFNISLDAYINLNTSHVKVQRTVSLIFLLEGGYLNTSHVKVQHKAKNIQQIKIRQFKYISC